MTPRQERTYKALVQLHTTAKGSFHTFSSDKVADTADIHRRSAHNDLQVLVDEGKVEVILGDGKRFYRARGYR
jgi:hypothetical protein